MITGLRESQLLEAADTLLTARRTLTPISALPSPPATEEEAIYIQNILAEAYGPIGGWKVGASSPTATPTCAPMPSAWMGPDNTTITGGRLRGVEAEISFLLAHDLPPRPAPYTLAETLAAIASCHPAIEILESSFTNTAAPDLKLSKFADLQSHGGFIFGAPCPTWRQIDFSQEHVTLSIDAIIRVDRTGSNPSGDLLRLLTWLANQHARTHGLRAGQWITTGSFTGASYAEQRSSATAHFASLGRVNCHFA